MFAQSLVLEEGLAAPPACSLSGAVASDDKCARSAVQCATDTFAVAAVSGTSAEEDSTPTAVAAAAAAAAAAACSVAKEREEPQASSLLFSAATLTANCLSSSCNLLAAAALKNDVYMPPCGVKVRGSVSLVMQFPCISSPLPLACSTH